MKNEIAIDLAVRFARELRSWVPAGHMRRINYLNAHEANPAICHSHDYVDANQAMIMAMAELGMELDVQSDEQTALLDRAWSLAKRAQFDPDKIVDVVARELSGDE
jgi:hypothetical protein